MAALRHPPPNAMPARLLIPLALLAALASTAVARADKQEKRTQAPGAWCGGALWRLETFSDPLRNVVDLEGTPTSIAEIAKRVTPPTIPTTRTTKFQRHVWRMRTVIDRYRIASNGEIVLILYSIDSAQYMNAYLPNPRCLGPRTRDRTGIIAARKELTDRCPAAKPSWELLGITVELAGVGFWNPTRVTRGALQNGAELRPLTNFKIVTGCGVG